MSSIYGKLFLMFMSFYACVVVYFVLNNFGSSPSPSPNVELPSNLRAEADAMLVTDPTEKKEESKKANSRPKER